MKIQIHPLLSYHLFPKFQSLPCPIELNTPAFPVLPAMPFSSSSFQHLPTQIFPSQTSFSPALSGAHKAPLTLQHFLPIFLSHISSHANHILSQFTVSKPALGGLHADVIPSDFCSQHSLHGHFFPWPL